MAVSPQGGVVELNGKSFMPSRHKIHRDHPEHSGTFIRALRNSLMGRDSGSAKELAQSAATGLGRGIVKGAVLLSLVAVGVVVPITAEETPPELSEGEVLMAQRVDESVGPQLLEFLSENQPPQVLSSSIAPVITVGSPVAMASRDFSRDLLEGCDVEVPITSANGRLKGAELCNLEWGNSDKLSPRAAVSLTALNDAFKLEFNRDLCLSSTYRSLADQRRVKASRGSFAATPGRSNHGLGLAIDLCGKETGNRKVWTWLQKNGPIYGWANPAWAKRGGSGPYEPWHWEYESEVLSHDNS